jgi:hypothetical protein
MDRGISTFQWSQRGDCTELEKNDVDQVRVFLSIDGAFSACESVGFRTAKIIVQ